MYSTEEIVLMDLTLHKTYPEKFDFLRHLHGGSNEFLYASQLSSTMDKCTWIHKNIKFNRTTSSILCKT